MRSAPETFRLKDRVAEIALDESGVHHPRAPRGDAFVRTPYEEVTHVALSPRGVWLGAKRSVYVLPRWLFQLDTDPERLVESLLSRIRERPGGEAQVARMAAVEQRAIDTSGAPATFVLAAVCVLVSVLQLVFGADVARVGYFSAGFVDAGDWWRTITWNFLHGFPKFPLHLVMNVLGLIALGSLTERAIGTAPTVFVMGLAALGSLFANYIADYWNVVGISGVVFGLFGAVFWLEHARTEVLPAWWRVPRRGLYAMLIGSALLGLLPVIAGLSHAGGFVFGALGAAIVSGRTPLPRPNRLWVRAAAAGFVAVSGISIVAAANQLLTIPDYHAHYLARQVELPNIDPRQLNDEAWYIAIDPESSTALRETALLMAERAVNETEHRAPAVLDTLAELQFQLGFDLSAVSTIEEAIALSPEDPYLIEQRRRFLGERDRDDPPWQPKTPNRVTSDDAGRSV
jgi:membrane associated rhomboid family serine protease